MNGTISITLENGMILKGTVNLVEGSSLHLPASLDSTEAAVPILKDNAELDFSLPVRPFMNEYADGLSGSKKFTLLVAHFAKGEVDALVDRAEVVDAWNKMIGLLGGKFNGAHESRAKDSGWVYVPASGQLALLKKWRQVLP